jgi:hypothetical protein
MLFLMRPALPPQTPGACPQCLGRFYGKTNSRGDSGAGAQGRDVHSAGLTHTQTAYRSDLTGVVTGFPPIFWNVRRLRYHQNLMVGYETILARTVPARAAGRHSAVWVCAALTLGALIGTSGGCAVAIAITRWTRACGRTRRGYGTGPRGGFAPRRSVRCRWWRGRGEVSGWRLPKPLQGDLKGAQGHSAGAQRRTEWRRRCTQMSSHADQDGRVSLTDHSQRRGAPAEARPEVWGGK